METSAIVSGHAKAETTIVVLERTQPNELFALPANELWAKVGDGVKRVRRRIVGVFEASTSPTKE
jgi:hypothetical protein